MTAYRVEAANPELLAETAEGAFHKTGGLNFDEIVSYLGKGTRTAQRVVTAGTQLRIFTEDGGKYKVTHEGADLAKANQEQRPAIFKKFLVRYDPFIIFGMLVLKKNSL